MHADSIVDTRFAGVSRDLLLLFAGALSLNKCEDILREHLILAYPNAELISRRFKLCNTAPFLLE